MAGFIGFTGFIGFIGSRYGRQHPKPSRSGPYIELWLPWQSVGECPKEEPAKMDSPKLRAKAWAESCVQQKRSLHVRSSFVKRFEITRALGRRRV